MKLYLLSRTDDWSWDEHRAFVVAAESEESALSFSPYGDSDYSTWTTKENIEVECIGESNSLVEKVIIASFNAG